MSTVASTPSWLNTFDPTNPSSLSGLLSPSPADPSKSGIPAGFNVLFPPASSSTSSGSKSSSGPSTYQQALDAFKVTADTFLIQSAINGYQPLQPAAVLGSSQAYYQGLNETAQQILSAGKSGSYGSLNALA